jgi:hypothetical protein
MKELLARLTETNVAPAAKGVKSEISDPDGGLTEELPNLMGENTSERLSLLFRTGESYTPHALLPAVIGAEADVHFARVG